MKKIYILLLVILIIHIKANAQKSIGNALNERDLYSDTWVATDAIGRTMPTHEQAGEV